MQKKLREFPDLEQAFKQWEADNNSQSTARSYWDRIKNFPYFNLRNQDQKKIIGMLNKNLERTDQKVALSQFIEFLYEEWEKDKVSDEQYTDLGIKKNAIQSNLNVPKKEKSNNNENVNPKEHWMYKDELVQLLRDAEPRRARLYYLLYAGGFRIGEIKRLTPAHVREDYGENGAVKILEERSKSEFDRMTQFRSKNPIQVLKDAPVGTWEADENEDSWDNVYFPELYAENEYYYLGPDKYCKHVGQRSSHSFRHVRTTDLVKATDMSDGEVRRRHGWEPGSSVIGNYVEFAPDRPPQTLEQYCVEKNLDILEVINR
jgi:integrase